MTTYKVVRFFKNPEDGVREVQATGLTLEEAQAHCQDPASRAHDGSWFDGYYKEEEEED